MIEIDLNNLKIIAISDTHGRHRELTIQKCDFLLHGGDFCTDGDVNQIRDFFKWFSETRAKQKPLYHLFGHVHSHGGKRKQVFESTYINISSFMQI